MNVQGPILQVEDSEEDILLLQYAWKLAGLVHPIQTVTDGRQAIDYLSGRGTFSDRNSFPFPCAVLLDLKLPYITGLEVLEWIRQQPELKRLVVIILSSSFFDKDIDRAYDLGVNAFLVKPTDLNTLADMCRAFQHFWLGYNRLPGA